MATGPGSTRALPFDPTRCGETVKPFVVYTLARLLLFLAAWALVWAVTSIWVEWNSVTALWTALVALAISAVASLVLLRGLRDRFALQVQDRAQRIARRYDAAKRKEDTAEQ
jgi:membrane protein implicated in regulation of membrane protease activity